MRTTYVRIFIHIYVNPLLCIYLLYIQDGYSINLIPNSDHYCPPHLYAVGIYISFYQKKKRAKNM